MRISDWSSDVCSSDLNRYAKISSAYTNRPSGSGVNSTTASVPPSSTTNGTANVSTLPARLDTVKSSGDTGRLITQASVCSLRSTLSAVEVGKPHAETITITHISQNTSKATTMDPPRKKQAT